MYSLKPLKHQPQPVKAFTIFTKTATARILGVEVNRVKEIREFKKVIWAKVKGQRPTFISKSRYQQDHIVSRIERSAEIEVKPIGGFSYTALNRSNGNTHKLWCVPGGGLQCECRDFQRQQAGGKVNPTCKHKLAVRQWLDDTFPLPTHAKNN